MQFTVNFTFLTFYKVGHSILVSFLDSQSTIKKNKKNKTVTVQKCIKMRTLNPDGRQSSHVNTEEYIQNATRGFSHNNFSFNELIQ